MIDRYRCPDNQEIPVEQCLKACRMPHRCMSLASLTLISQEREYNGVSASMAGTGARAIYLSQKHHYSIDPMQRAFALRGTGHHGLKEGALDGIERIETELKVEGGTLDFFGDGVLVDYKMPGSFAVKKRAVWENKRFKEWNIPYDDPWRLQLNFYRIGLEKEGHLVKEMWVEATLRDGGLWSCPFDSPVQMLPIEPIENTYVENYYQTKEDQINAAIHTDVAPPLCTDEESWGLRRCMKYCDVWMFCLDEDGWDPEKAERIRKEHGQ